MNLEEVKELENHSFDDYLAWLNLQGDMGVWRGNRMKMDYVFRKIRSLLKPGMRACDIGLGEGYSLKKMLELGLETSGIDISGYAVEYLQKRFNDEKKNVYLHVGDVSDMEVESDRYDLVTCFDVLEHIPDLNAAVENIEKMLSDNGLLVATIPFQENMDESRVICPSCRHKFHRYGHHHSFQSLNEIRAFLPQVFKIEEMGIVPYCWFGSPFLNAVGTWIFRFIKNRAQSNARSILYFVARKNKS